MVHLDDPSHRLGLIDHIVGFGGSHPDARGEPRHRISPARLTPTFSTVTDP